MRRVFVVGITGGVASGKTSVSRLMKEEGAYVIDADQIAKELVQPHQPAWRDVIQIFGQEILREDGSIDRKKLARLVFSDPEQRKKLNGLLHPRVRKEIRCRLEAIHREDPDAIVIIDAALLVETGFYREMDQLVVVTSEEAQQIERLKERDDVEETVARGILTAQLPLSQKVRVADFVIQNEGSRDQTKKRTQDIFRRIKEMALRKHGRPSHGHRPDNP